MTDTVREQIIQAIMARASTLDPTIVRGRLVSGLESLMQTVLNDDMEQVLETTYQVERMEMTITIGSGVAVTDGNPSVLANQLLGILRQMFSGAPDPTFGGLIDSIRYRNSSFIFGQPTSVVVGVLAQFLVAYHTVRGNPYLIDPE